MPHDDKVAESSGTKSDQGLFIQITRVQKRKVLLIKSRMNTFPQQLTF